MKIDVWRTETWSTVRTSRKFRIDGTWQEGQKPERGNSRVIFLPGFIVHALKAAKTLKVFNRVIRMCVCGVLLKSTPKATSWKVSYRE